MSVINQMLKDLEDRAPVNGQTPVLPTASRKTATLKIILFTSLVLLGLNVLGYYIWNLQTSAAPHELEKQTTALQSIDGATTTDQSRQKIVQAEAEQAPIEPVTEQQKVRKPQQTPEPQLERKSQQQKPLQHQSQQQQAQMQQTIQPQLSANTARNQIEEPTQSLLPKPVITNDSEAVNMPKAQKTVNGKMSVSRRQLTSGELVVQTLAKAEKSLINNDIDKAEQFFEEILIIEPSHEQARKKLAALWFGRQAYQQAINLLSHGIAINRFDSEMRLMKAQIQLKQGQTEAAYNTLKPLADIEQEEYQVLLANVAQQIEQYPSAIMAYQVLIKMQPYSGRWYLGLAIVYDKNSQFSLAKNAYQLALTKADLSASSVKFAKQRMQAIGE